MTMKNKTINLFDKYSLVILPELNCYEDGPPGKRVLFLEDRDKTFIISFEEGMKMMDMMPNHPEESPMVSFQCCKDDKYIHQRRTDPKDRQGMGSFAFFHMELDDDSGGTRYLPGQMTAKAGYQWADGVEPILLDLMDGIAVKERGLDLEELEGRKLAPCGES